MEKIGAAMNHNDIHDGGIYYEDGPKIYLLKEMIKSPAYRSLSRVALLVLNDFMDKRIMKRAGYEKDSKGNKRKKWVCENFRILVYPYTEAVENGFSRVQFRNAVDELQSKGFLDITHLGSGGRKPADGEADVTLYRLDERWRDYDAVSGKSTIPPQKPRGKDARKNRGFQRYWADQKKI